MVTGLPADTDEESGEAAKKGTVPLSYTTGKTQISDMDRALDRWASLLHLRYGCHSIEPKETGKTSMSSTPALHHCQGSEDGRATRLHVLYDKDDCMNVDGQSEDDGSTPASRTAAAAESVFFVPMEGAVVVLSFVRDLQEWRRLRRELRQLSVAGATTLDGGELSASGVEKAKMCPPRGASDVESEKDSLSTVDTMLPDDALFSTWMHVKQQQRRSWLQCDAAAAVQERQRCTTELSSPSVLAIDDAHQYVNISSLVFAHRAGDANRESIASASSADSVRSLSSTASDSQYHPQSDQEHPDMQEAVGVTQVNVDTAAALRANVLHAAEQRWKRSQQRR